MSTTASVDESSMAHCHIHTLHSVLKNMYQGRGKMRYYTMYSVKYEERGGGKEETGGGMK